jgi:hypothetical protein
VLTVPARLVVVAINLSWLEILGYRATTNRPADRGKVSAPRSSRQVFRGSGRRWLTLPAFPCLRHLLNHEQSRQWFGAPSRAGIALRRHPVRLLLGSRWSDRRPAWRWWSPQRWAANDRSHEERLAMRCDRNPGAILHCVPLVTARSIRSDVPDQLRRLERNAGYSATDGGRTGSARDARRRYAATAGSAAEHRRDRNLRVLVAGGNAARDL